MVPRNGTFFDLSSFLGFLLICFLHSFTMMSKATSINFPNDAYGQTQMDPKTDKRGRENLQASKKHSKFHEMIIFFWAFVTQTPICSRFQNAIPPLCCHTAASESFECRAHLRHPKNHTRLLGWVFPPLSRDVGTGLHAGCGGGHFSPLTVMIGHGCISRCWPSEADIGSTRRRNGKNRLQSIFFLFLR
jgi:hypothetical protein